MTPSLHAGSDRVTTRRGRRIDVSTIVDLDRCAFLRDHSVGGSVLVPTALQLEMVVAAVPALRTGSVGLALTNIAVQDPVILKEGAPHTLRVEGVLPFHGASGRFSLGGPDRKTHLSLRAARIPDRAIGREVTPVTTRQKLRGQANRVYPPLFHGPAFQVIERFGPCADGMASTLATHLGPWDLLNSGEGRVAQLIELLLQTCGVWELAETGRMMRPALISRLQISPRATEPSSGAWAEVWPGGESKATFDGVVRDGAGHVLVRMQGYRPTELDAELDQTERDQTDLDHHVAAPMALAATGTPTPTTSPARSRGNSR